MNGVDLVALALILPLGAAGAVALSQRTPNLREGATLIAGVALAIANALLLPQVLEGARPRLEVLSVLPGLDLAFEVEPLGMMFALIASVLWIVSSVYSIGYMRGNHEGAQTRFYACFALAIGMAMGVAFAANAFTLFIFYELLTLVTYPLVTHHGSEEARKGGRTYLALLIGTSIVFFLPALVFTQITAGTTEFRPGGVFDDRLGSVALSVLFAMYVFGIGKAALMPFHRWLPAAMVAPTPVSALLHAVAVVKAGVFSVIKIVVYLLGVDSLGQAGAGDWLVAISGFTIIAASVVALTADNLKRRLAYSTISQLSYCLLAVAILAPISIAAAALQIAMHAVGKITLFFAAGSIYTASHKTLVSELDGIGRRMPWTMSAFAIGALSMIGLPPAAGFVSKWYMLSGAMAQSQWLAVGVIVASTALNAAYFLPIVHRAFWRTPAAEQGGVEHGEAPLPIVLALVCTAALTIGLFLLPEIPIALAGELAGMPR